VEEAKKGLAGIKANVLQLFDFHEEAVKGIEVCIFHLYAYRKTLSQCIYVVFYLL